MTILDRKDIKNAILTDARFRESFSELKEDIDKVLAKPECSCNIPIYDKFFKYKDKLSMYFTNKEIKAPHEIVKEEQNKWTVINCKVEELEEILNKTQKFGRKYLTVARWEDHATVIVNDMGIVF